MTRLVTDQLPMLFHPSGLGNEPLVRCKLTTWEKTGETSLSVAWMPILGSCEVTHIFLNRNLRRCEDTHAYHACMLKLLPKSPPAMISTFEIYLDPTPTIERQFVYDTFAQVPHLGVHYTGQSFREMYIQY